MGDGINNMLSSVGQFFTGPSMTADQATQFAQETGQNPGGGVLGWLGQNPQVAIGGLGGIVGLLQNYFANQQIQKKQDYAMSLLQNPAKFEALVNQNTQPLNQNLINSISRATSANMAEKGLGSTPLAVQSALAQGLAPYEAQNQSNAQQAVLSLLGEYMKSPNQAPANLAPLFQAMMMSMNKQTPTTPSTPATPGLTDFINPLNMGPDSGFTGAPMMDTGSFSDLLSTREG